MANSCTQPAPERAFTSESMDLPHLQGVINCNRNEKIGFEISSIFDLDVSNSALLLWTLWKFTVLVENCTGRGGLFFPSEPGQIGCRVSS
jgi:hypothetical protein